MQKIITLCILLSHLSLKAQSLYFPPIEGNEWETVSVKELNWCEYGVEELFQYLEDNKTKAFILLKDGKIVFEKYFNGHTENSLWYWASAGKTVTALLTGIAQEEKLLSIDDPVSKYLGTGWTNCNREQEEKITIRHQLSMTTGLDDGLNDLFCTDKKCLNCLSEPGERWSYHNAPYTLLDEVLSAATGKSINQYLNKKLKQKTGIKGAFVKSGYNKIYFSNARSMARFGLLILNKGNWGGTEILKNKEFYQSMINTSQGLNKSYGYYWWLNGKESFMIPQMRKVYEGLLQPKAPDDLIIAVGKNGQFINVIPSENIVWIRMGEAPESMDIPFKMNNKIWEYLNTIICR